MTESGRDYLYIYGANNNNQKNISKESFKKRIAWIKKNYDKIVNLDIIPNYKLSESDSNKLIREIYTLKDFQNLLNLNNNTLLLLGYFFLSILMSFPTEIFERIFDVKQGLLKKEPAR